MPLKASLDLAETQKLSKAEKLTKISPVLKLSESVSVLPAALKELELAQI